MRKTTKEKMAMYYQVLTIVGKDQAVLDANPKLAAIIERLAEKLEALNASLNEQEAALKGVSLEKTIFLNEFKGLIMDIKHSLFIHASSTKNESLKDRNKMKSSALYKLTATKLQFICEQMLADMEEHEAVLAEYGITAEKLQRFHEMYADLAAVANSPRVAIIVRHAQVEKVASLEREIADLLRDELDRLMYLVRKDHADLYNKYLSARKVVEHRTKRIDRDPEGASPEPDDGAAA